MDNIEHIHISKVPFSIETKAKSELKKYLNDIRSNLDEDTADEVMHDIEARMPELLVNRHTKHGGVITHADVEYLKKQLGEPEQFSSEDISIKQDKQTKKLFRESDSAVFGGVAGGIGKYFNIDSNFIRAAFFILLFFYGFGAILYVFLWILLPEAKTSADKLMMSGEPVTVANLQNYRSSVKQSLSSGPRLIRKIFIKIVRFVSLIFTALFSLFLLSAFGAFSSLYYMYPFKSIVNGYSPDYLLMGLLWLGCLTLIGILVLLTARIWGYKNFRLNITAIILSTIFVLTLASSFTTGIIVFNHFSNKYGNGKDIRSLSIGNSTPTTPPQTLNVESDSHLNLSYVISSQPMHATYESLPGMTLPNIQITNDKGVLNVDSTNLSGSVPSCLGKLCKNIYLPVRVFLYGPAVSQVNNVNGAEVNINNANLGNSLTLNDSNNSFTGINNSFVNNMIINAVRGSNVSAINTTAQNTEINLDSTSSVTAPITNSLTATLPDGCSIQDQNNPPPAMLTLPGFPNKTIVNGQAQTIDVLNQNACVSLGY